MGGLSLWHWLVVGIVILLLFGKGRFSDMMGDVAQGLKSFKKGMTEDDEDLPPRRLNASDRADPPVTADPLRPVDEVREPLRPTDAERRP